MLPLQEGGRSLGKGQGTGKVKGRRGEEERGTQPRENRTSGCPSEGDSAWVTSLNMVPICHELIADSLSSEELYLYTLPLFQHD